MTTATRLIRLGTRASALATAQSGQIAAELTEALGREVQLVEVTTAGDVSTEPLAQMGGTGVFVSALRQALLRGEVDVAVHSLKDLPTTDEPGIALAAVPEREASNDVIVARDGLTLAELPAGSRVGTGSPRRVAQLAALGLPIEIVGVRGNVDTRIGKVRSGELDAVVLARAGLARLGRLDDVTETLTPEQMLPAPGQGALAIECREGESLVDDIAAALDDAATRACVVAERTLLAQLEAGCSAPVGALAEWNGSDLVLRAVASSLNGEEVIRRELSIPVADLATEPAALGRALAAEMLADGAGALVTSDPTSTPAAPRNE